MVTVAIVGMLATMAIPSLRKAYTESQISRFINDLRIACNAFEVYASMEGDYPPDGLPAIMPEGMTNYLEHVDWVGSTPIGGRWDWDRGVFGVVAGVSVHTPVLSQAEMAGIDRRIDDGDLRTGLFRARSGGYICIIQE